VQVLQVSSTAQLSWQMAVWPMGLGGADWVGSRHVATAADGLACQSWKLGEQVPPLGGRPSLLFLLESGRKRHRIPDGGIVTRPVRVQGSVLGVCWVGWKAGPDWEAAANFPQRPLDAGVVALLACLHAPGMDASMEWNAVLPTLYRNRTLPLLHMCVYVCAMFISLTLT
jgi:hypothetical protein